MSCPRCGQLSTAGAQVCDPCRAREHARQGEAVRLFEPAPAQLAGQLAIGCTCPDDCNCRASWRTNYCGCAAH